MRIDRDNPQLDDVQQLLREHLDEMFATSPPESVHALDASALAGPTITFWTARANEDPPGSGAPLGRGTLLEHGTLLGCGALKRLDSPKTAELKSMRTATAARGRGVATLMLLHIVGCARAEQLERIYLETGSDDYFAPARRLYARHGFTECQPFANYTLDPSSVFMVLEL